VAALLAAPAAISTSRATTTEQVVTDRNTGLAISGFDPVTYFIDGAPLKGSDELEYAFAGAVWRFRNEGNRGAFIADPEVYMPRYGGYDPLGIARGVAVPGDPRVWLLAGERLYLFYTAERPERLHRRHGRVGRACGQQMAAGAAHADALTPSLAAADGSPQATKAGMRKSWATPP
jgi:hypothetical protein